MDAGHDRSTVVTHEGGPRFAAEVRGHRLLVDQPVHAGGDDAAPTPLELLGAGLGSCIALYVKRFCDARAIPSDGLRVEVTTRTVQGPSRVEAFHVRVIVPQALSPEQGELLVRVARSCPVHNTLTRGAAIDVAMELGAAVGTG